jgi:hypothetical protein
VRKYVGGGAGGAAAATPTDIDLLAGAFTFDEQRSIYIKTSCEAGGKFDGYTSTYRLVKVTQDSSGAAKDVIHVAGNCIRGMPESGKLATQTSFTDLPASPNYILYAFGQVAVANNGALIYYQNRNGKVWKIVNGRIFKVHHNVAAQDAKGSTPAIPAITNGLPIPSNQTLNFYRGKLYVGRRECTVSTQEVDGGEICAQIFGTQVSDSEPCVADEIPKAKACINDAGGYVSSGRNDEGTLFFRDGPELQSNVPYRIRYVDGNGIMRTLMGSLPFFGEGLHRSVIRASFGGIFYKSSANYASKPSKNLTAFPEGLYFMDNRGMVLGRIDSTTQKTEVVWGNQSPLGSARTPAGTLVDSSKRMGTPYEGGSGFPLARRRSSHSHRWRQKGSL